MESSNIHKSLRKFDSHFCANDECVFWVNIYDFILHSYHFVGWFWSKNWELEGLTYTCRNMVKSSCRHIFLRMFDSLYCINDGCIFYDDVCYFNFHSLCFIIRCKSLKLELEKYRTHVERWLNQVVSSCLLWFLINYIGKMVTM